MRLLVIEIEIVCNNKISNHDRKIGNQWWAWDVNDNNYGQASPARTVLPANVRYLMVQKSELRSLGCQGSFNC
jgi:hypothetical protein